MEQSLGIKYGRTQLLLKLTPKRIRHSFKTRWKKILWFKEKYDTDQNVGDQIVVTTDDNANNLNSVIDFVSDITRFVDEWIQSNSKKEDS